MDNKTIMMDEPAAKNKLVKILIPALIVAVIALGGLSYYLYSQLKSFKKNPQQIAQQEIQSLIEKVGKLVVLPEGETPTVATVADPEKLKDQPFFANAKKGDKVLIYTNAKKAILYDPVNNKIVEIAPVNIGNNQTQTQPQTQPKK
ncbi:MAG: hypothetical protein AAB877_03375 [Patescibacteria group bacterium]